LAPSPVLSLGGGLCISDVLQVFPGEALPAIWDVLQEAKGSSARCDLSRKGGISQELPRFLPYFLSIQCLDAFFKRISMDIFDPQFEGFFNGFDPQQGLLADKDGGRNCTRFL